MMQAVDRAILGRVHEFLRNQPAMTQTLTYKIETAPIAAPIQCDPFFYDSFLIRTPEAHVGLGTTTPTATLEVTK